VVKREISLFPSGVVDLKPKEQVLEYIDSLSPYQWRTYLSYIIQPKSLLPETIRVDLAHAAIGEGRCAILPSFEEGYEEVKSYVDRLCDLKMNFEVITSGEATLPKLRDAISRKLLLVIKDLDDLKPSFFQEYLSLSRYRASGSLDLSANYGLILFGQMVRRTKFGNPEAATYNKLGRGLYRSLTEHKKAFGYHMVTPDLLERQRKPSLEPESPYSDSYLVNSFFSKYKEKFIVDTGIKSIWR
jgi:hypothetical protein